MEFKNRKYSKNFQIASQLGVETSLLAKALRDKNTTYIDTPQGRCCLLKRNDVKNGNHDGMNIKGCYEDYFNHKI